MKMSPSMMGMIYFGLAGLFIFLAIQHVSTSSWDFFAICFAAVAAVDVMIGIRYFRLGASMQKKDD